MHKVRTVLNVFRLIQGRADYLRMVLDEIGHRETHWLQIWVHSDYGRAFASPAFKDTALAIPLSHSSGHPIHVHRSWPMAMLRTLFDLCTFPVHKEWARAEFIQRLTLANAHPSLLDELRSWEPRAGRPRTTDNAVRLAVPYHPLLYHHINFALRELSLSHSFAHILSSSSK